MFVIRSITKLITISHTPGHKRSRDFKLNFCIDLHEMWHKQVHTCIYCLQSSLPSSFSSKKYRPKLFIQRRPVAVLLSCVVFLDRQVLHGLIIKRRVLGFDSNKFEKKSCARIFRGGAAVMQDKWTFERPRTEQWVHGLRPDSGQSPKNQDGSNRVGHSGRQVRIRITYMNSSSNTGEGLERIGSALRRGEPGA